MACCTGQTECNHIVTIGYLKEFISGLILSSDGTYYVISDSRGDDYCPTYGELTDNSIVPFATEASNWKDNIDGILIDNNPAYSSTELVKQEDLYLVYTRYKEDSARFIIDATEVSECGGQANSTTYATFTKNSKHMDNSCGIQYDYEGESEFEYERSTVSFERNTYSISQGSDCNSYTGHGDSHVIVAQSHFSWRNVSKDFEGTVTQMAIDFSATFKNIGIVQMDGITENNYFTVSLPCNDRIISGSVSASTGEQNSSIDVSNGSLTIGRFEYSGTPQRTLKITVTVSDGNGTGGTYDMIPCELTQYSAIPGVIKSEGSKCEEKVLYLGEKIECEGNI